MNEEGARLYLCMCVCVRDRARERKRARGQNGVVGPCLGRSVVKMWYSDYQKILVVVVKRPKGTANE